MAGRGSSVSFSVLRDLRSIRQGDESLHRWRVQKTSPGASHHAPVEFLSEDMLFLGFLKKFFGHTAQHAGS